MNWGKGIIAGMVLFMLFILTMCVYMFMVPTDDYDHQYYEKGLTFNHDYDKEKRVVNDHAQPSVSIGEHSIKFTFIGSVNGTVKFQRPSNTSLDKIYQLNSGTGNKVEIPIDQITKGQWQLIFDWTSNKRAYLYQREIFLK